MYITIGVNSITKITFLRLSFSNGTIYIIERRLSNGATFNTIESFSCKIFKPIQAHTHIERNKNTKIRASIKTRDSRVYLRLHQPKVLRKLFSEEQWHWLIISMLQISL